MALWSGQSWLVSEWFRHAPAGGGLVGKLYLAAAERQGGQARFPKGGNFPWALRILHLGQNPLYKRIKEN